MSDETKKSLGGSASHTQDAAQQGLPGRISRPIKLTFLGAGSGFTPRLLNDVLRIPNIQGGTIALVDIDAARLELSRRLIVKLVEKLGGNWTVSASTKRREVLPGTHYVVNCVEVSGLECVVHDNDIPLKYGVDQCIGDTLGPGGLFKSLRTIPVWIDILKDCEELCPQAVVLNYTNPMGMMCLAAARASSMRVVGLCHSVQGTSDLLAKYAGVNIKEMEWECGGINHLAWFTKLRHNGQDLYPRLYHKFQEEIAEGLREFDAGLVKSDATDISHSSKAEKTYKQNDLIRKDMCLHFGAFITESSGHLSEYLPYYRKSASGRKLLRLSYDGGSRFYATNWPRWRKSRDEQTEAMLEGREDMDWKRSWEYASWIIEAMEKDFPFRIHGNVMNTANGAGPLISNLPTDGCVEVACMIDRNGINPTRYGALPPQMAAICRSNMSMIELGALAALERSKEIAIHALMLDPLTSALCTPAEIRAMTLELFEAEQDFLADYR